MNFNSSSVLAAVAAAGLCAAPLLLVPSPAAACGGLFCQQVPVEQNAERILFEVNGNGTITTTVEIRYAGTPEGFSWVVPIPDTPELEVTSPSVLALLDTATVPQIVGPELTCSQANQPPMSPTSMGGDSEDFDSNGGVDVEDLPQVGPFDPLVVSSTDPDALADWLNENGYLITDEMRPFVAQYVANGSKFLAMKLAPEAGVADISPLRMTYPATEPMIPIVLTAVAAEPDMGVLAFVAANERYASSNFENLEVDVADVQSNPAIGENNYYPLTSWMIDEAGGKAFITQYAAPSAQWSADVNNTFLGVSDINESIEFLQGLFTRRAYVTRLWSRVSSWEMDIDPSFEVATAEGNVNRVFDLTDRPPIEVCAPSPADEAVPCGDMYCGEGALCATTVDGIDGCVCDEGWVGRTITAPVLGGSLQRTTTCQKADFDMLQSARDAGTAPADPCTGYSCGDGGACMDVNGFATCACEDGFAAITDFDGTTSCSRVERTFTANQLLWTDAGCACSSASAEPDARKGLLVGLVLLPLLALRRRTSVS